MAPDPLFTRVFLLLFASWATLANYTCLNEKNESVEWFIAYKFPHGGRYAYLTPSNKAWQLASSDIGGSSLIMNTVSQLPSDKDRKLVYGVYNDENPSRIQGTDYWGGHLKGAFGFSVNDTGFWMIHSVPKFTIVNDSWTFPPTGKTYAQHFFCMSLSYGDLRAIVHQLLISRPMTLAWALPEVVASDIPEIVSLLSNKPLPKTAITKLAAFQTLRGGLKMLHFSKSRTYGHDLYSDFVAVTLNQSLRTETWRHSKSELPSQCTRPYTVENIRKLRWSSPVKRSIRNGQDHAKWAITIPMPAFGPQSQYLQRHWTCLGDINREMTQFSRGGGTMCVSDTEIWQAFNEIVVDYDHCNQFIPLPGSIPWTRLKPAKLIDSIPSE